MFNLNSITYSFGNVHFENVRVEYVSHIYVFVLVNTGIYIIYDTIPV